MAERTVAYVLKGYPRISELFIASEIWRLEQLGVPLQLYVLKPSDEAQRHPVVDRIETTPTYLPATRSLSASPFVAWLRTNLGPFLPALRRVARRHPVRLLRSGGAALAQAVRARKGWRLRAIYAKEWLYAMELADRVERHGSVRHLHAHFAHGTTTVTWLAAMVCRLPFSFTGHAKDIYRESLNPAGLLARKMRAAAFVVTCTEANREHLEAIAPTARVHRVYHGLNADFGLLLDRSPEPEGEAVPAVHGERLRVVSVGRRVAKKGFDVLLEAVALLRDRGVELEVVLAGEPGEEDEALEQLVTDRGLRDLVSVRGTVGQRELLELYRGADVFALACRVLDDGDRDGIPNVLVEAMAAGLPAVSTAVSGIPELVVDGHNGLLVPPEDPAALADALLRLVKDPALREQLGSAGAATVRAEFDGPTLARRMADLLRSTG